MDWKPFFVEPYFFQYIRELVAQRKSCDSVFKIEGDYFTSLNVCWSTKLIYPFLPWLLLKEYIVSSGIFDLPRFL